MYKSAITAMAALMGATVFGAITGTITTDSGSVQKGEIRWSTRDKAYAVTKGNTEIQVKPSEVEDMQIDVPAGYEAAVAQVLKGQGAAAIPVLQKIVKDYQRLQWDKPAGRYLAEAYLLAGKANDGLRACEAVIATDATAAFKGDLAPAYWNALFALGRKAKLESALEKAAKSGDAAAAGMALTMRGDIIFKEGTESADAARKALTDGYLRAIFLYDADADVAAKVLPEALYKAAKCFEKLGQAGRADAMRMRIKQDFADSRWAGR